MSASSSSSSPAAGEQDVPTESPAKQAVPIGFSGIKRPRSDEEIELDDEYGASVRFDVSGTSYRIPRAMIMKHPKTYLANLLEIDGADENAEKVYRIDRDPLLFRYVLDFYRGQRIVIPMTESVERMSNEIDFFLLPI